jgi:hypothetical protein
VSASALWLNWTAAGPILLIIFVCWKFWNDRRYQHEKISILYYL